MRVCLEAETAAAVVYILPATTSLAQSALTQKTKLAEKNVRIERLVWYQPYYSFACYFCHTLLLYYLLLAMFQNLSWLAATHAALISWVEPPLLTHLNIDLLHTLFHHSFLSPPLFHFYNSSKLLIQIAEYINDVAADIFDPRGRRALIVQLKVWKVDPSLLN